MSGHPQTIVGICTGKDISPSRETCLPMHVSDYHSTVDLLCDSVGNTPDGSKRQNPTQAVSARAVLSTSPIDRPSTMSRNALATGIKKKKEKEKRKSVTLVRDFAKWCWGVVIEMTRFRAGLCGT